MTTIVVEPRMHPRMLKWLNDAPSDAGRPSLSNPDVRRLVAEITPGSEVTDLGGYMSLNARLGTTGMVLRVHRPFVSRPRLLAVQEVRRRLAHAGLVVPVPFRWRGSRGSFGAENDGPSWRITYHTRSPSRRPMSRRRDLPLGRDGHATVGS